MPVTVIPGIDNSGSTQGFAILASALAAERQRRYAERLAQQNSLETLRQNISKLPEEEQNAALNIPPEQFQAKYGVDINTVAPLGANGKRVLVAYPGGTLEQQQTKQSIATSKAQENEAIAIAESNRAASQRETTKLARVFGDNYRTADGKRLTFAQQQQLALGDPNAPEVAPQSEYAKQIEELTPLLGGPEASRMIRDVFIRNNETIPLKNLEKLRAEIENQDALTRVYNDEANNLEAGFTKDGKPISGSLADSKFAQQTTKAIDEVLTNATAQFSGLPSELIAKVGGYQKFQAMLRGLFLPGLDPTSAAAASDKKLTNSDTLSGLFFGPVDGVDEYIAQMRKSLGNPKKMIVSIPKTDKDNKLKLEQLNLDDPAVRENLKYIRTRTAQLLPLVQDLMDADPSGIRLKALAVSNPLFNKAVQTMRPDIYEQVMKAKGQLPNEAVASPPAANRDPNMEALRGDADMLLQKRLDELDKLLKGDQ